MGEESQSLTVREVKEILETMPDDAYFYTWSEAYGRRYLTTIKSLKLNPDGDAIGMDMKVLLSMKA